MIGGQQMTLITIAITVQHLGAGEEVRAILKFRKLEVEFHA